MLTSNHSNLAAGGEVVYVGLGSNVGPRAHNLSRAVTRLALLAGTQLLRISPVYETTPWGPERQGLFLNLVTAIRTTLSPMQLLRELKRLETVLGRVPTQRWGPRSIDMDILLFGHRRLTSPDLTIPHPRLLQRQFVLVPLAEIAPELCITPGTSVKALACSAAPDVRLVGCLRSALAREAATG